MCQCTQDADIAGQPQIVTCSGGQNTGSLKVVRKGAEFEELAVVEGLSHVVDVWPLRAHHNDQYVFFYCFSYTWPLDSHHSVDETGFWWHQRQAQRISSSWMTAKASPLSETLRASQVSARS